ncbi:hypothetical protein MPH61_23420 [Peribacillus muralis]|uniref:hypothetical protein n=1 Tax=Peribacillus muralis TaxID=264697 RepID=UPI001F4E1DF2|nr:hypothetical protein [Peribacillus muralis]MCK1995476.1 hypothetical protein [Peribacillus muralis]MCK2016059.1 hypothetical protein [Peribacillus muralis]
MRKLYLFEIEANEKPLFNVGEWENLKTVTSEVSLAKDSSIMAYGEVEDGRYIELYDKAH